MVRIWSHSILFQISTDTEIALVVWNALVANKKNPFGIASVSQGGWKKIQHMASGMINGKNN